MTQENKTAKYWDRQALIRMLDRLADEEFTGSVEIHYTQGGLGKIVKHETIK